MSGDFSLQACKQIVQSCFSRLIGRSSKCGRSNAYTVITVQVQVAQRADNFCPTDKLLSSYSEYWCFKLWKFRQNTYKNSRIWSSQILKDRSIDCFVHFVWEIKEAMFCLPLFIFILYCRALRFLAILSIVWEAFLKSSNVVVIWQSAYEACRVHHSTVVASCIETQVLGVSKYFEQFFLVEFLTWAEKNEINQDLY